MNNHPIYLCIFSKKSKTIFDIIVIYIDDLNLDETLEDIIETIKYLNKEFEIKDFEKTKFCLAFRSSIFQLECWLINQHISRKPLNILIWINYIHLAPQ